MSVAAALTAVGSILGGASGPVSSALNAHMYKKYGLHEPEYLAASQRAAGINPIVAESGSLPAPPDLGFNMDIHPEAIVANAQESEKRDLENQILKEKKEQAVNDNLNSFNQARISGQTADLQYYYGDTEKKSQIMLSNAQAAKLMQEADLLEKQQTEASKNQEFWQDAGSLAKWLKFGKELFGK